jgi:branched-chain amino acid transport system permease protein
MLGGVFLGLLENLGIWKLPSEWQSAISFGVFLVFIVLRPRGFFGRTIHSAEI